MYEVMVRDHFSAAHQLRDSAGKCENLHGHNWQVDVVVEAEGLTEGGVVIDFDILKKHIKELLDRFDHRVLNDIPYFQDVNPSAENIAHYVFGELKRVCHSARIKKVTVWETGSCGASYSC